MVFSATVSTAKWHDRRNSPRTAYIAYKLIIMWVAHADFYSYLCIDLTHSQNLFTHCYTLISSKFVTRSTQRAQWQTSSTSRVRIVIRNGLPDPGGDPDRHQNWAHWSLGHALYPSKKFRQNPFTTYSVIRRTDMTDKQTDRQTDRSKNITSFGGDNKAVINDPTTHETRHCTIRYTVEFVMTIMPF